MDVLGQRYVEIFERYVRLAEGDRESAFAFFNMMHPEAWKDHQSAYAEIIQTHVKKRA